MSNITVLVQGPVHPVSLSAISSYLQICPVVMSCWDLDPNIDLLEELPDAVKRLIKPMPRRQYYLGQPNDTFTYQVHSIYNGLLAVETPYVIKTRSDEYYNLLPLIERFNQDRDRIICGNIFFKKWSNIPFHLGDHLYMGATQNLSSAFKRLVENVAKYNGQSCAEQSLTMAILDEFNLPYDKNSFLEVFDVIDINELKPFLAQWQRGNRVYDNEFVCEDVIKNISEL